MAGILILSLKENPFEFEQIDMELEYEFDLWLNWTAKM